MKITRVWLMLTDKCNLNCSFCYQKNKGSFESSMDTVEKAIEFILENSVENVEIMLWGGEPLLRFDLIKETIARHPCLNLRIATNGHLLTQEMVDFFYEYRDTFGICLSLEVGKKCPKLFKLPLLFPNFFVHLIVTDVSKAFSSVLDLYKQGVKRIQIGLAHAQEYSDTEFTMYAEELKKILLLYRKDFFKEDRFTILNWDDRLREHFMNRSKYLNYCGAGCTAIAITPEGDIYPCDWFYDLKKYKMGDIWTGFSDTRNLFLDINKNRHKYFSDCNECPIKEQCGSHMCLAENYLIHKSIYKSVDSTCKVTILERELVIKEGMKEPQLRRPLWKSQ